MVHRRNPLGWSLRWSSACVVSNSCGQYIYKYLLVNLGTLFIDGLLATTTLHTSMSIFLHQITVSAVSVKLNLNYSLMTQSEARPFPCSFF